MGHSGDGARDISTRKQLALLGWVRRATMP
jgi:hypothetical protein